MRVPDEAAIGLAQVTIDMDGWPEGRVVPRTYQLPVERRNPLPVIKVSPEQERVLSVDGFAVEQLRFTPDGKTLVAVKSKRVGEERMYQFHLYDPATGKSRGKCLQIDPEPLTSIYTPYLAISRDSKLLAVHYNLLQFIKEGKGYREETSGQLHVFELATGRELWHQDDKGWSILSAAFSPDCKTLMTANNFCKETGEGRELKREFTGEVRFLDAAAGKEQSKLSGKSYEIVWSVKYSPDGKYVAYHNEARGKEREYHLGVWDIAAEKLALKVPGSGEVAFSPDSTQIAMSSCTWTGEGRIYKRAVSIWDLKTGKEKASQTLPTGEGWLSAATWSLDGKYLFVSSSAGELWRWNPDEADSLDRVETIALDPAAKPPPRESWGRVWHPGAALYVFAVNGELPRRITQRNLADDYDELPPPEIVVWDLKTMQRRATLTGHRGVIRSLAFSPDGKILVSCGSDGTIRFWKVPEEQQR